MTSLHDQVAELGYRAKESLRRLNLERSDIKELGNGALVSCKIEDLRFFSDTIIALLARIREIEWQPIETAPKDGTRFIAGHHRVRITKPNYFEWYIAVYAKECSIPTNDEEWGIEGNDGEFYCPEGFYREAQDKYGDEQYIKVKPTHWMPLPSPPEPKAPEEM